MCRVHLTVRTEGITAFSNRYGVVVWMGEKDMKTISVDANLFENGLVWTGPQLRFLHSSNRPFPSWSLSLGQNESKYAKPFTICTYRTYFHAKTCFETQAQGYIHL